MLVGPAKCCQSWGDHSAFFSTYINEALFWFRNIFLLGLPNHNVVSKTHVVIAVGTRIKLNF